MGTEEEEFQSRSQAVQRSLPRPAVINSSAFVPQTTSAVGQADQQADNLIKLEMLGTQRGRKKKIPVACHSRASLFFPSFSFAAMLRRDAVLFPPPGAPAQPPNAAQKANLETFESDEIAEAVKLIELEEKQLHAQDVDDEGFTALWESTYKDWIFVPSTQKYVAARGRVGHPPEPHDMVRSGLSVRRASARRTTLRPCRTSYKSTARA